MKLASGRPAGPSAPPFFFSYILSPPIFELWLCYLVSFLFYGATQLAERRPGRSLFIQAANDYSTAPTPALAETARTAGVPGVEARIYPAFGLTKDEGHFFYKEGPHVWGAHVATGFWSGWL